MSNLVDPKTIASSFWDGMTQDDFAVPRVKLNQKKDLGMFQFNTGSLTNGFKSAKLIVPTKTRVLYAGSGAARCSSDNFYVPSKRIGRPYSQNCLTCPMAAWGDNDMKRMAADELGEKSLNFNKPMCAETYNLLMADEKNNLFFIAFQKSQLKIVQEKLFSRLRYEFGNVPAFHVAFDIKSNTIKNGKDEYSTVSFDNFRAITDEADKDVLSQMYSNWKLNAQNVLAKQHEQMDTEKNVTPQDEDEKIPF